MALFLKLQFWGNKAPNFEGEGKRCCSVRTKDPLLATFTDPFNYTIGHSFFTKRVTITKIPHLLDEKSPT